MGPLLNGYSESRREQFSDRAFEYLRVVARIAFTKTRLTLSDDPDGLAADAVVIAMKHIDDVFRPSEVQHDFDDDSLTRPLRFPENPNNLTVLDEDFIAKIERSALNIASKAVERDFIDLCRRARTANNFKYENAQWVQGSTRGPSAEEINIAVSLANKIISVSKSSRYRLLAKTIIEHSQEGVLSTADIIMLTNLSNDDVKDFRRMLRKKLEHDIPPPVTHRRGLPGKKSVPGGDL